MKPQKIISAILVITFITTSIPCSFGDSPLRGQSLSHELAPQSRVASWKFQAGFVKKASVGKKSLLIAVGLITAMGVFGAKGLLDSVKLWKNNKSDIQAGQTKEALKKVIDIAIEKLKNPNTRLEGSRELNNLREQAIPVLIEALKNPNEDIRREAALALYIMAGQSEIPVLVETLLSESPDISECYARSEARAILGMMSFYKTDIMQALIKSLFQEGSPEAELLEKRQREGLIPMTEIFRLLFQDNISSLKNEIEGGNKKFLKEFILIYTHPLLNRMVQEFGLNEYSRLSLSIATGHTLVRFNRECTMQNIDTYLGSVTPELRAHLRDVVFGRGRKVINITNAEEMFSAVNMVNLERRCGVEDADIQNFKGVIRNSKQAVLNAIVNTKGPATIFFCGHGSPEHLVLGFDRVSFENMYDPNGISYKELAEALAQRGSLSDLTILIDACFSYNFAANLINELERLGAKDFPSIVATNNISSSMGYSYVGVFLSSLEKVSGNGDLKLLDLLKAERYSFGITEKGEWYEDDSIFIPFSKERLDELFLNQKGIPAIPESPVDIMPTAPILETAQKPQLSNNEAMLALATALNAIPLQMQVSDRSLNERQTLRRSP